jgi:hypothetical protein
MHDPREAFKLQKAPNPREATKNHEANHEANHASNEASNDASTWWFAVM